MYEEDLILFCASIIKEERKEAFREGRIVDKNEDIINMYNDNLSLELISEYTGLSIEEVNKIIEDNKQ